MKLPANTANPPLAAPPDANLGAKGRGGKASRGNTKLLKGLPSTELNALPRQRGRKSTSASRSFSEESVATAASPDSEAARALLDPDGDDDHPGDVVRKRPREDREHGEAKDERSSPSPRRDARRRKSAADKERAALGSSKKLVATSEKSHAEAPNDSASMLADLLLLASRHGTTLQAQGLSPLQIQLLAVREYLGLGTVEDRRFLLSDVKAMLVKRQETKEPAPPAHLPAGAGVTAEQSRNALLPLMLLNALQRRGPAARERTRDRLDLVVALNERVRK